MALHVALFHYMLAPSLRINTFGHAHMPLFILLSGFGIGIAHSGRSFCRRTFWQARFARTMPLVYLTHAVSMALTPFGHGQHPGIFFKTLRHNIAATSMWLIEDGDPAFGWNGPAWTVSTLAAYYWIFPLLNPTITRLALAKVGLATRLALAVCCGIAVAHGVVGWLRPTLDEDTGPWMVGWTATGTGGVIIGIVAGVMTAALIASGATGIELGFSLPDWVGLLAWVQFALGLAMNFHGLPYVGRGYWPATGWVPSRLPLFMMGAVAGIAEKRRADERWHADTARDRLADRTQASATQCATRTDTAAFVYLATLALCSALSVLDEHAYSGALQLKHLGPLVQLVMPHVQLALLVGLQRSSSSLVARVCLHRSCQWLGRISVALYLCHMPIYQWLTLFLNGSVDWTLHGHIKGGDVAAFESWAKACKFHNHSVSLKPDCQEWMDVHNLAGVGWVPFVTILSLVTAWALERYYEAPARRLLRPATRLTAHVEHNKSEGMQSGVSTASPSKHVKGG